nr:AlkA N-terminal domain-containing protein [Nonomuraea muscovyensis]
MDVAAMLGSLGAEATLGAEKYAEGIHRRSLVLPHGTGVVALSEMPGAKYVGCELRLDDLRDLTAAVSRRRRLLDLDAGQEAIDRHLGPPAAAAPAAGHTGGPGHPHDPAHRGVRPRPGRRPRARDQAGPRPSGHHRRKRQH